MYVSEFNAMYSFFILSSVYDWAFEFSSTIGTGTVSNRYKINECTKLKIVLLNFDVYLCQK